MSTNKQIAEQIKTSRLKKKRVKKVAQKYNRSAEKKEYQDAVDNYTVILPNI